MKTIEGKLTVSGYRFAIVLSRFNEFIGKRLLDGALKCFSKYNFSNDNIDLILVPGAFELPVTAQKIAESKKYNAVICLGAVIRGGTPHFEYVAGNTAEGILEVSLKCKVPIIFGVLTTDTYEQALERSAFSQEQLSENDNPEGIKEKGSGNKGWDAALTAIEMADLFTKI